MARMIHTGSVIVDQVMEIEALPEPGGDIISSNSYLTAGGGLNSMVAAHRDGLEVVYCGLVGTGPFANIISTTLASLGIESYFPVDPDKDNGYCVALVEASGERTFITHVGVEGDFALEHLERIALQPGDQVYVSGYSLATDINAIGLANWLPQVPAEIPVVVDPSPIIGDVARKYVEPLLARADVWTSNAREAAALTGEADPGKAAKALAGLLRPEVWVVVRNGGDATLVTRQGEPITEVAPFPAQPIDTNGAGDVHTGVLMAGLARGLGMLEAVRRANAAASIKVTRSGPTSAPTAAEIDALLAATG